MINRHQGEHASQYTPDAENKILNMNLNKKNVPIVHCLFTSDIM